MIINNQNIATATLLQWNNLNPILNSLISHKFSSTPHEVGLIDVEISVGNINPQNNFDLLRLFFPRDLVK